MRIWPHIDFISSALVLPSAASSIVVNLRPPTLALLQSTLDESSPPNSLLCTLCMQDRGHISKCSDAQSNKDRHTHSCSGSRNKPMMQRTNSRTQFHLAPPLALPLLLSSLRKKINQVCIWRSLLTCHLGDEGVSESGVEEERLRREEIPRRGDSSADIPGV